MNTLEKIMDYVIKPLTHICNCSLIHGVFPDCFKIVKVLPLHKGNSKYIVSNYRPELEKNHSTCYAVNEIVKTIMNTIEGGMYGVGEFIDLKKAFDTVDHSLLIKRF